MRCQAAKGGAPAPAKAANATAMAIPMRRRGGTVFMPKTGATATSAEHRNSTMTKPNRVGVRNAAGICTGSDTSSAVPPPARQCCDMRCRLVAK